MAGGQLYSWRAVIIISLKISAPASGAVYSLDFGLALAPTALPLVLHHLVDTIPN